MGSLWSIILRRFVALIFTLVVASFVIYALVELMPGDYAERELFRKYSGTGAAISQSEIIQARISLGLDRLFIVRYGEWIWGVVTRFDFGQAFRIEASVNQILAAKFLYSFVIVLCSMLLSYLIAIPLGVWSGSRSFGWGEKTLTLISYMGLAIPNFAVALLLMLLNILFFDNNITGLFSPEYQDAPWSWGKFGDFIKHAYIPILVLGWASTAYQLQTVRALMKDEVNKLYVLAALARGIPRRRVFWRYPARHAILPVVSTIGFDFSRAFNELPIVASILVLGEIGQELLLAFLDADQNTVAGILLIVAFFVAVLNMLSDLLMLIIDPRASHRATSAHQES